MTDTPRNAHGNRAAPTLSLFLSLLYALAAYGFFRNNERAWLPAAVFATQGMIAAVLRFGWTVPCLLAGVIFGVWIDPLVKGGTVDSQMYETITNLLIGSFVGLAVGIGMDSPKRKGGPSR